MGQYCCRERSHEEHAGVSPPTESSSKSEAYRADAATEPSASIQALRGAENCKQHRRLVVEGEAPMCVCECVPGSNEMLVATENGSVTRVNWTTGRMVRSWQGAHQRDVNRVLFDSSSSQFYTASRDKLIKSWNLDHESPHKHLRGAHPHSDFPSRSTATVRDSLVGLATTRCDFGTLRMGLSCKQKILNSTWSISFGGSPLSTWSPRGVKTSRFGCGTFAASTMACSCGIPLAALIITQPVAKCIQPIRTSSSPVTTVSMAWAAC